MLQVTFNVDSFCIYEVLSHMKMNENARILSAFENRLWCNHHMYYTSPLLYHYNANR